jgi:hypothetical protein
MPTDEPNPAPESASLIEEDDAAYWQRRAEAELEMAQKATRSEVVAAHVALAEAYLERLYDKSPPPGEGAADDEEKKND